MSAPAVEPRPESHLSGAPTVRVSDLTMRYGRTTAVDRVSSISRATVREQFEKRFTAERMAGAYLQVYERCLAKQPLRGRPSRRPPPPAAEAGAGLAL